VAGDMTMNRVIHQAVRRDLGRLDAALASARDGDRQRAQQLGRAYANLHRELTQHHEGEDTHVFPYLAKVGVAPDLLTAMDDEHHAMAAALAETRTAMEAYAASGSASDAAAARETVAHTADVVDRHLAHEEDELEPALAPHLGTPEWKAVEKRLRPPSARDAGTFMAWIQDGMTDEGRAYLRTAIPVPVTFLLSRIAGRSYRRDIAPTWRARTS
jgi:hemerythrin-like domain-containing protein